MPEQPASSSSGPEQDDPLELPPELESELESLELLGELELEDPPESPELPEPPPDPLPACAMLNVVSAGAA